jgi:hypothetical protein
LTSNQFAVMHPDQNACVHAMIRQCVSSQQKHIFLNATVACAGDGHKAWKTLSEFYENEKTLDLLLRTEAEKLKALSVKDGEEFQDFAHKFMHTVDRLKLLYKRMHDLKQVPTVPEITNYKKEFLDKIRIKNMSSRIETIKQNKSDYGLQETFIELLAFDMETNLTDGKTSSSVIEIDQEPSQASKMKHSPKNPPNFNQNSKLEDLKRSVFQSVNSANLSAEQKSAILASIGKNDGNSKSGNQGQGNQKKQSGHHSNSGNKNHKKRRAKATAESSDYEAWSKKLRFDG